MATQSEIRARARLLVVKALQASLVKVDPEQLVDLVAKELDLAERRGNALALAEAANQARLKFDRLAAGNPELTDITVRRSWV